MSAIVIHLPAIDHAPVKSARAFGASSGVPVSHVTMGVKGRLTGAARNYRGRPWFEVDVGEGDHSWWPAGVILRTDHRQPMPLIGSAA